MGRAKMQRWPIRLGYISTIYRQTGRSNLCNCIEFLIKSLLRLCAIFATSLFYLCLMMVLSFTEEDENYVKKRSILDTEIGRIFTIFAQFFIGCSTFRQELNTMNL